MTGKKIIFVAVMLFGAFAVIDGMVGFFFRNSGTFYLALDLFTGLVIMGAGLHLWEKYT